MEFSKAKGQFGSWAEVFRPFIESKQFDKIFRELKTRSADGAKICPEHINVFRCFKETPYDKTTVVIMAQDPYNKMAGSNYIADGLALSAGIVSTIQQPLSIFYDGMEQDLAGGFDIKQFKDPDLTYLTKQGVLLLNTALTTEQAFPGSHKNLWRPFMEFFIEGIMNRRHDKVVFILIGSNAKTFEGLIKNTHHVFTAEHPAHSIKEGRPWKHERLFSNTNKVLRQNKHREIEWYQKLPF